MDRVLRKFNGWKSDKSVTKAEAEAASSTTDITIDNTAFGLKTWVEGVEPVVE